MGKRQCRYLNHLLEIGMTQMTYLHDELYEALF